MIEIEKEYLRVWIDRSIKLMYSEWQRPVSSEEYREGSWFLLDLLNEYKVLNWIADHVILGEITGEDEQWTLVEFAPALLQTQLQKIAWVSGPGDGSPSRFEARLKNAQEIYIGHVMMRKFGTYKEAADWMGDIPA